ncbi:DUF6538 domain-containing protein, partial [Mameliella sp. CS4]|uniref:DUF6538 domain-containing protein n=1 Tax=Mameliella sp. CS4 TaxID=2862329 RepID=UPI00351D3517
MAENKTAPHSFVKDGVFYFVRRVPKDLKQHYTSSKISYSLRTRSALTCPQRTGPFKSRVCSRNVQNDEENR